MKKFMKDIKSFKDYMTDGYKPDYFSEKRAIRISRD